MKSKKFTYFVNHGDENGNNCYTIIYGAVSDIEHIIIGVENKKKDAIEVCKRLNGIIKISPADKEEITGEFSEAVRALKRLDKSHENLDAIKVYESLEFFKDKLLGKC